MKKNFGIIIFVFIVIGVFLFIRFVIGGGLKDDWICENGGWIKHGNPSMEMPNHGCGVDEKKLVEEYIKQNISQISPIPPVLGGSWYVISIEFLDGGLVNIVYEDGHIQESIQAKYSVDKNGGVVLIDLQRKSFN